MQNATTAIDVEGAQGAAGVIRALLHRFAGLYLLAYVVPCLIGFPGGLALVDPAWALKRRAMRFVAHHLLRLDDGALGEEAVFDAAIVFTLALPAILIALVRTAVAPRVSSTELRFRRALELYLRVMLASTMVMYAFQKVFPLQFHAPTLDELAQPVGALGGMRLLWVFMGSLRPYQVFGGWVELAGALLLLFRRTTTLGALVLVAALANVVALDYSVGMSVGFEAAHLMLIALFLAAPDLIALGRAFVFGSALSGLDERAPLIPAWPRAGRAAMAATAVGIIASNAFNAWQWSRPGVPVSPSPIAGVYEVEDFRSPDGFLPDSEIWRDVTIAADGSSATLVMADGSSRRVELASAGNALEVLAEGETRPRTFQLERPDPAHLVLDGPLRLRLLRIDEHHFERMRAR